MFKPFALLAVIAALFLTAPAQAQPAGYCTSCRDVPCNAIGADPDGYSYVDRVPVLFGRNHTYASTNGRCRACWENPTPHSTQARLYIGHCLFMPGVK